MAKRHNSFAYTEKQIFSITKNILVWLLFFCFTLFTSLTIWGKRVKLEQLFCSEFVEKFKQPYYTKQARKKRGNVTVCQQVSWNFIVSSLQLEK